MGLQRCGRAARSARYVAAKARDAVLLRRALAKVARCAWPSAWPGQTAHPGCLASFSRTHTTHIYRYGQPTLRARVSTSASARARASSLVGELAGTTVASSMPGLVTSRALPGCGWHGRQVPLGSCSSWPLVRPSPSESSAARAGSNRPRSRSGSVVRSRCRTGCAYRRRRRSDGSSSSC